MHSATWKLTIIILPILRLHLSVWIFFFVKKKTKINIQRAIHKIWLMNQNTPNNSFKPVIIFRQSGCCCFFLVSLDFEIRLVNVELNCNCNCKRAFFFLTFAFIMWKFSKHHRITWKKNWKIINLPKRLMIIVTIRTHLG